MKFDWDDTLLKVVGVGGIGWGVFNLAAPDKVHKFYYAGHPNNKEATRCIGLLAGTAGGMSFNMTGRSVRKETKKQAMKTLGVAWLVAGGMSAYNVMNRKQRKEFGLASATAQASLGAALLTRGFQKK